MALLLDTHALLWWLADSPRLPRSWNKQLGAPTSRVCVSAASIWEIAVKRGLGKLRLDLPEGLALEDLANAAGFEDLPVRAEHAAEVSALPPIHTDPFDRLLVAQARIESLTLVSADKTLARYDVPILGTGKGQ